jgi:hypothetical protein
MVGKVALLIDGCSTILNQLVAGLIIVRHMKSILDLSLPVRVYGPIRLTHNAFHGVVMTSFDGT